MRPDYGNEQSHSLFGQIKASEKVSATFEYSRFFCRYPAKKQHFNFTVDLSEIVEIRLSYGKCAPAMVFHE